MSVYEDKFIAYVDILGFKELVKRSEKGSENAPTVDYIFELMRRFGSSNDEDFDRYGPTVCPCAPHSSLNLNFRVTQISDCAVISAETSPAGLINLVHHCYKIAFRFLKLGHLCRGYITRGNIVHTDTQFFGTGYVRAYESESKVSIFRRNADDKGTPFIEIDPQVRSYVAEQPDVCVKTVFGRLTEGHGSRTAISPLFALKSIPDIVILRLLSQLEKQEAETDASVRGKIEHITRKLREALSLKEKQVEMIDFLSQPFSQKFPR